MTDWDKIANRLRAKGRPKPASKSRPTSGDVAANAVESLHSEWLNREPVGLADLAVEELPTSPPEACRIISATEDFVFEEVPVPLAVPFSFLVGVALGKRLAAGELDALLS